MTELKQVQASIDALLEAIGQGWFDMATQPLSKVSRTELQAVLIRYGDDLLCLLTVRDDLQVQQRGEPV